MLGRDYLAVMILMLRRPFAQRYAILLAAGKGSYQPLDPNSLTEELAADVSRRVLQAVRLKGWQIGKTRVFLRAGQLAQLEVGCLCRHNQLSHCICTLYPCACVLCQVCKGCQSASGVWITQRSICPQAFRQLQAC